jgi:hypothetical protein
MDLMKENMIHLLQKKNSVISAVEFIQKDEKQKKTAKPTVLKFI